MENPRIALFVNTPLRDTPAAVLTAFELCQRGAICHLVTQAGGYEEIWALSPDFVLLPYFRPYFAERARKYAEVGIQFGLLDTEGVIWPSMEDYEATFWKDRSLSRKASCICMWGNATKEYTTEKRIFDEPQVYVTGSPRFDFYSEPYSAIYKGMRESTLASERKLILINTNFTNGNYSDLPLDKFVDNFSRNFGYDKADVTRWCNLDLQAIEETVRLAGRLARDFPDVDIIIRPHPQEKIETYIDKIDRLPNLRVVRSGTVTPWILRASAVIQRGCTTAVEASLAGVPAISPQWIEVPHYYPIPESVSLQAPDYDYLKELLQSIVAGNFQMPPEITSVVKQLIGKWFYKIDGQAHKRVAEVILNNLSPKIKPDSRKCSKSLYGLHNLRPFRKALISNVIRYGLGLSPNWSFRTLKNSRGKEADESMKLEAIEDLVGTIGEIKADEKPKRVKVSKANDCEAYIIKNYTGRTIVMSCE